jgi:hypothetical protein
MSYPEGRSGSPVALITVVVLAVAALVVAWLGLNFLTSFKSVDSGQVCVVKEGGPFDGRNLTDVRQPGSGIGTIGIFNDQLCLPTTERDSNDVLEGDPSFPTRDAVKIVADAQILFNMTTDGNKVRDFVRKYGRRTWGGHEIFDDEGWISFLRQRFSPVVFDTYREVIGASDCTQLNNLCQYVQEAEKAVKEGAKSVDTNQNLANAQKQMQETLKIKLHAAFGDDYFENVRVQNLRPRFESGVDHQVKLAQQLRTQNANAALAAQKRKTEATGLANAQIEQARGKKLARYEEAKGLRRYAAALSDSRVAEVEKIKALCGVDAEGNPKGCANLQVLGGSSTKILK